MGAQSSYEWECSVLGEPSVYPTHPLIVALAVMERFESLEHANEPSDRTQSCKARTDEFIQGAGCAVTCGLQVLKKACEGGDAGVREAIGIASAYWDDWEGQNDRNAPDAKHGRAQATRIEPAFKDRVVRWSKGELWASPWRLRRGPSFKGNRFHRFPDLLPTWQAEFICEMLRTERKEVGLADCGGGWFALCVAGDDASRRERVRRSTVLSRTAAMKTMRTRQEG